MTTFTATYSPEDDKLRLYASSRLAQSDYERVKEAGFGWAPKQELFYAIWTPEREDLLLELAGEIEDEDKSLVERAEERAERFEKYSEKRAAESDAAHAAVDRITSGIPLGQPILVGHHSERHARKDAERIENGMRRAIKAFEESNYWKDRAAGAIAAARYKERPAVRARRVKKLEAEVRGIQKRLKHSEMSAKLWSRMHDDEAFRKKDGTGSGTFHERAIYYAGSTNTTSFGAYSDLTSGKKTAAEVQASVLLAAETYRPIAARWIEHLENRLTYERSMLEAEGKLDLLAPKPRPKHPPILNYPGKVTYRNRYTGDVITTEQVGITKAQYAAIGNDYKGTRLSADGTHRTRSAMHVPGQERYASVAVYLTDSKFHERPEPGEPTPPKEKAPRPMLHENDDPPAARPAPDPRREQMQAMKDQLRAGVQVVSAPQLFPTPPELAERMVELAGIEPGMRVLEPSAGTGALIEAMPEGAHVVAVEINNGLCRRLNTMPKVATTIQADFLDMNGATPDAAFDRVVMNPPFEKGADIKHIERARALLKPGGRLVALCANGPRQREKLMPLADFWEDLPPGTFKEQGTNVNVALLVIEG